MIFCCLSVGRYPRCLSDLYLQYLLVPLPSLTLYFRFLLNIEQFPLPLPLPTIAHVATSQAEHPELNRDTGCDPAHLLLMIYSAYWKRGDSNANLALPVLWCAPLLCRLSYVPITDFRPLATIFFVLCVALSGHCFLRLFALPAIRDGFIVCSDYPVYSLSPATH